MTNYTNKINQLTIQYVFAELVPVVSTPLPRELNGSLQPVVPEHK